MRPGMNNEEPAFIECSPLSGLGGGQAGRDFSHLFLKITLRSDYPHFHSADEKISETKHSCGAGSVSAPRNSHAQPCPSLMEGLCALPAHAGALWAPAEQETEPEYSAPSLICWDRDQVFSQKVRDSAMFSAGIW